MTIHLAFHSTNEWRGTWNKTDSPSRYCRWTASTVYNSFILQFVKIVIWVKKCFYMAISACQCNVQSANVQRPVPVLLRDSCHYSRGQLVYVLPYRRTNSLNEISWASLYSRRRSLHVVEIARSDSMSSRCVSMPSNVTVVSVVSIDYVTMKSGHLTSDEHFYNLAAS